MCSIQYTIQYTVYSVQYTIECTLYSVQYTVHSVPNTVYSIQCTCEYSGDPGGHQPHSQAAGPAAGQGAAGDTLTTLADIQLPLCEE